MKTASIAKSPLTPSLLIDAAYEDFCKRADAGQPVDLTAFLGEYPEIRSTLGRLLELHVGLEQNIRDERAAIRWPNVGDTVRGLRLVRKLGEGAFSRVYLAIEPAIGNRQVAVKFTSQAATEAFILGRIDHPNIAKILYVAYDEESHLSIIAMPYCGSATVSSLLDRVLASPKQPEDAGIIGRAARDSIADPTTDSGRADAYPGTYEQGVRSLFADICDAVGRLHEMGILHRDLKPSNVLFRPNGSPMLLDFNLADDPSAPESRFGGTYLYMAPEQLHALDRRLAGEPDGLGPRSDLFSIGVMLWEVATGQHPFGPFPVGLSMPTIEALLEERHRRGFRGKLPTGWRMSADLAAIAQRCLAIDPKERPSSAAELRALLLPTKRAKSKTTKWGIGVAAAVLAVWVGVALTSPALSPTELRAEGESALRANDFAKAEERFTRVIAADSRDARGWLGRGMARLNRVQAEPDFGVFARGDRKLIDDFVVLPRGKLLKESLVASLADVQTAEALVQSPDAKVLKAYLSQLMGQSQPSEALYEEYLAQTPSKAAQNNLAVLYSKRGDNAKALGLLDAAIAKDPRFQIAYFNRALIHLQLSRVKGDRNFADIQKDHWMKCVENLRLAVKIGPKSGELHYQLACAYRLPPVAQAQDTDKIFDHLEQAVKIGIDREKLRTDPIWAGLAATDRFQQLVALAWTIPTPEILPRLVHPLDQ